jgi:hypothetical protein
MSETKTNTRELIGVALTILCLICLFEGVSELENFSHYGRKGILMNTTEVVTKQIGKLFIAHAVKPIRPSDLDFPPEPDSLSDNSRMFADSVTKL